MAARTPGETPGIPRGQIPLIPNISLPVQTPSAEDWYEQGFALTGEERYEEAVTAYRQALAANRSLLNAWYYLGDALFHLGRYPEALLAFENATAVDPDFVDAYFYEGLIYRKLGRPDDEKDALRRGLEAADRKEASGQAATAARTGGSFPLATSSIVAVLGTGMAAGLWTILQREKR